jgi:hypothetical protein
MSRRSAVRSNAWLDANVNRALIIEGSEAAKPQRAKVAKARLQSKS